MDTFSDLELIRYQADLEDGIIQPNVYYCDICHFDHVEGDSMHLRHYVRPSFRNAIHQEG